MRTRNLLAPAALLALALSTGGCFALGTRLDNAKDASPYFLGTRTVAYEIQHGTGGSFPKALLIPWMPVEIVADTVLLPIDAANDYMAKKDDPDADIDLLDE